MVKVFGVVVVVDWGNGRALVLVLGRRQILRLRTAEELSKQVALSAGQADLLDDVGHDVVVELLLRLVEVVFVLGVGVFPLDGGVDDRRPSVWVSLQGLPHLL